MTGAAARVVLVTTPDRSTAVDLVRELVEEGAVACGTIVPEVTSIYRWRDGVEEDSEALVVFKTTEAGAKILVREVPARHPYDVPEVLVLPVTEGHEPYLKWILESVRES